MNEKIKNKVIVWSIDDFNTLGLMRELGPYGLDLLFLIQGKKGIAAASVFCKQYVQTESIEDGFNFLKNNFKEVEEKPILIISSDAIISYLDDHSDELEDRYILPICGKKGNSKKYTDKSIMTELANKIGFDCPKSRSIKKGDSLEGVSYPCIIKPRHQQPGHYNEFKYKICKNEKQLKHTLKLVRKESEFIVQDLIEKKNDLLIYGGRMRDGKTLIAGGMIRDRFADSGSSSHGIMTSNIPSCANTELISRFLDEIDYYGPFSFEYGLTGDKAFFFEVNLRNDGTSDYFNQAGANIPLAYVYSSVGIDYSNLPTKVSKDAWFIDEIFDYENVIKRTIKKEQWKKEKSEATVFKYYNKNDLEPWKMANKTRRKQMLQDFILKRFRLQILFVLDKLGLKRR